MQKIKAGAVEVEVLAIRGMTANHNGAPVEALQVSFPADITEAELEALLSNPWELYDDAGTLQGIQAGVNYISEYVMTFFKVPDVALLQGQLNETARRLAAMQSAAVSAETRAQEAAAQVGMYQEALARLGVDPSPEAVSAMLLDGVVKPV